MMKGYLVNVTFGNRVVGAGTESIRPLVDTFNHRNKTNITWMANLCSPTQELYVRLSGADADKTTECATFIAEKMNDRQSLSPIVGAIIPTSFLVVN